MVQPVLTHRFLIELRICTLPVCSDIADYW